MAGNSLYATSLVELGIIPMNSTGIYLNGFTPNSTGRIRLVEFDRALNTGQIGWKFIVCHLPGRIGYHPNEFNWHLSISMDLLPIRLVEFNRALNTGQIGWKFTEITFVCLPVHSMAAWLKALDFNGFTPNSTGRMPLTGNECNLNGFTSKFDQLNAFNTQFNFNQSNSTGH